MSKENNLKDLAKLFFKLGVIAFGGPAAHIAMMKDEVVNKRQWMTEQHFLDLIGATNLIPGPNSTELAIHIGRERAGIKGLIVAGLCFIMPAVFITGCFAFLYKQYGMLPQIQLFIFGIKPAIIVIILASIFPLAKDSIKSIELAIIGIVALILSLLQVNDIYIMFGAGLFALVLSVLRSKTIKPRINGFFPIILFHLSNGEFVRGATNWKLFLVFLKIGAILYGSGYVLFAFLDSELVSTGILPRQQLVDAITVGQCTPGPVFSSVTFIGYQLGGLSGAALATIGIFFPSFVFVALLNPLVMKMRESKWFSIFLDAVNVASVAVIITVCYQIGKDSISDWRTILIFLISLILGFGCKKINSVLIVICGSLIGYLLSAM